MSDPTNEGPAAVVAYRMSQMQSLVLEVARVLTDDQLAWRANGVSPSIGFHVWSRTCPATWV